jgi:hypothetical protein
MTSNSIAEPRLERGRRRSCVVCGRKTDEMVRPMGVLTEPIWCCHSHDDRTIFHAWIHSLPEWQRLQTESPSNCSACNGPCHCEALESLGHRCACWPPSAELAAEGATS